jgi:hypothetical protein
MTPEERLKALTEEIGLAGNLADIYGSISYILEEQNRSISGYKRGVDEILTRLKQVRILKNESLKLEKEQDEILKKVGGNIELLNNRERERLNLIQQQINGFKKASDQIEKQIAVLKEESNILKAFGNELWSQTKAWLKQEFEIKNIWGYLQKIDGGIRSMQLSMGITGERAEDFRRQMQESVNIAARFGVDMEHLVQMQGTLNETTGRANVLSEQQVQNMVLIAKGTGMANEEAASFLGNMMNIGASINDSTKFIEGTVNETAKLGLNSSTVLKGITSNIGKLNQYRFQGGVDGLKKMVQESTKFKVSMDNAFAVADKFRTLEGLLEAGAQLRVLGGEFAKIDEFKISFLARNDPGKLTEELAKMTKGMASFNKETGLFEVSDINMDILRSAAEATNQDFTKLVESTKKFSQVNLARKQIIGGTEADREMIANLATFKKGSNIATIEIDGKDFKVNELTDTQIGLLRQQEKTIKQRAEESQNFNETFNNTITQLKATLLPLLEYINDVLEGFNKIFDTARDENGKMKKWAAAIPIAGLLLGTVGGGIIIALTKGLFSLAGSGIGKIFEKLGGGGLTSSASGGVGLMGASLKTLTGIGIAAIGVGTGFMLATKGATSLVLAFKGMSGGQITAVALAMGVLGASMYGIISLAPMAGAASVPLFEFAAAIGLIGAGVGAMNYGMGKLLEGAGKGLSSVIRAVKGDMDFSNMDFENLDKLKILQSFKESDIERMNEMFEILNKIDSIDLSKLDNLAKLFASGTMKVTLEGNPVIKNDITVDIDGEKFYKKVEKMIPIIIAKGPFSTKKT